MEPRDRLGAARLRGQENTLPDLEGDLICLGALSPGIARALPPVEDVNMTLGAGALEGLLRVLEAEARVQPPVEDVDEVGTGSAVKGFGAVFLSEDGGAGAPPGEDGG